VELVVESALLPGLPRLLQRLWLRLRRQQRLHGEERKETKATMGRRKKKKRARRETLG
jgi:hypothetical protein